MHGLADHALLAAFGAQAFEQIDHPQNPLSHAAVGETKGQGLARACRTAGSPHARPFEHPRTKCVGRPDAHSLSLGIAHAPYEHIEFLKQEYKRIISRSGFLLPRLA